VDQAHGVTVDWVLEDLRNHEPAPGGYDLVLVAYLHLPSVERAAVLADAAAALAAHGTLLVIGHDLANLTQGVGGPQDPAVLYTPEAIVAELDGLAIHRAESVRRPVDTLVRATRD
jgi:hypothetical protein